MKIIVRAFVLSLVATGAYASMQTNVTNSPAVHANVTALPVPVCPPDDPKACNICAFHGCDVQN